MSILTAIGDNIYGETRDGVIATVYGDPVLATKMAAAPELLEALRECLPLFNYVTCDAGPEVRDRVLAVIAKAT